MKSASLHQIAPATVVLAIGTAFGVAAALLGWSIGARAMIVAVTCLSLWLTQLVPIWFPTLVLWAGTTVLLFGQSSNLTPVHVLGWFVDPVLLLFLGGFALATAAERQGADRALAALTIRLSHGRSGRLIAVSGGITALLSMWMSNVAAAALLIGTLRPLWASRPPSDRIRRSILLVVALGANVGGIATPIGTGPNGIALAAVSHVVPISFLDWMLFALPLTMGLLLTALAMVFLFLKPRGGIESPSLPQTTRPGYPGLFAVIFTLTVAFWLSEPLHGVPAPTVALGAVATLCLTGVLGLGDVKRLDWGTLVLIAGGIALGRLLEAAGLVSLVTGHLLLPDLPDFLRLFTLALVAATFSALMSNTATAAVLVPLATTIDPAPSSAIIVAIACSLGMPFAISTPPNAMAISAGLRTRDLALSGLILMFGGCALVALTGPQVLAAFGIP